VLAGLKWNLLAADDPSGAIGARRAPTLAGELGGRDRSWPDSAWGRDRCASPGAL